MSSKKLHEHSEHSTKNVNKTVLYKCYACDVTASSDCHLLKHLVNFQHRRILSILPGDYKPYIYCPACKINIFEDETIVSHLNTDEHKERLLNFNFSNKSDIKSNENSLESFPGFKTVLDELDSNSEPKKPTAADLRKKKKFQTIHFDSDYSKLFLEMGASNIFNVDQRKINKLKLGTESSFLLNKERLCLVCHQIIPNKLQLLNLYEHFFNVNHIQKLDQWILQSKNVCNQFSDLDLAKEFMKEVDDKVIFCFACKDEISNNQNIIKKHIENENHRITSQEQKRSSEEIFKTFNEQLNKAWYFVQSFWCQFCRTKFECNVEFADHLKRQKHLKKVNELLPQGTEIIHNICIPCASMSMGLANDFTKHCQGRKHLSCVRRNEFVVPKMSETAKDLLNNVTKNAEAVVLQSNSATLLEKDINLILKSLEQAVKLKYPEAKAYIFGSSAVNLALGDSDVDVYLDCESAYAEERILPFSKIREFVLNSEICFKSQPDVWDLEEVILFKVRVPIIKVHHRDLGINCDVSFTSGLGVEKTKIVRLFMISYPSCRKMTLFLKKWYKMCSLSEFKGLTSYSITWFVIFYLQMIKVLPSVAELVKNKNQLRMVNGWETSIAQKISVKADSSTFKELLIGFFKFYANYDYRFYVMCPLIGKSLRKEDFTDNHIAYLPAEMSGYNRYLKSMEKPEIFRIDSPLCLQDPIELVLNITRPVSKLMLRRFIEYCQTSAEILSNSL